MHKIIWDESYSVGNETLDFQHKKVIEVINQLLDQHLDLSSQEELLVTVSSLYQYTQNHLMFEETLLSESDYSNYEKHKDSHDKYREYVSQLMDKLNNSILSDSFDKSVIQDLLTFLLTWWKEHILKEDMMYKIFLKNLNAS